MIAIAVVKVLMVMENFFNNFFFLENASGNFFSLCRILHLIINRLMFHAKNTRIISFILDYFAAKKNRKLQFLSPILFECIASVSAVTVCISAIDTR